MKHYDADVREQFTAMQMNMKLPLVLHQTTMNE